jgi:hypothetical protein
LPASVLVPPMQPEKGKKAMERQANAAASNGLT